MLLRMIIRDAAGKVIDIREQRQVNKPLRVMARRFWVREAFDLLEEEGGTLTFETVGSKL